MKEIKIRLEDRKIVFKVEEEDYFIDSNDFLSILDKHEMFNKFRELDPAVKFAELNTVSYAAKYQLLKDRGVSPKVIAEKLGVSVEHMNEWLNVMGRNVIEIMKREKPHEFNPVYQGLSKEKTENL